MIRVGAVILNYKTWENTCSLAFKLSQMPVINSIVIVDNCSPDVSRINIEKFLKENNSDKIRFIETYENGGYAKGNNIGLKYLINEQKCDYCIVSNPDTLVDEKCISNIIAAIKDNPEYAILTCCREYSDGSIASQYWDLPTMKLILLERSYIFRKNSKQNYHYSVHYSNKINQIDTAPGSFFVIKSDVLEKVGYLDEQTFLYFEENCLAKKVGAIGKKIGIVTDCKYFIKKGEASTIAVKKAGTGMRYYLNSETHYVKEYLKPSNLMLQIYNLATSYMQLQGKIKAFLFNVKQRIKE